MTWNWKLIGDYSKKNSLNSALPFWYEEKTSDQIQLWILHLLKIISNNEWSDAYFSNKKRVWIFTSFFPQFTFFHPFKSLMLLHHYVSYFPTKKSKAGNHQHYFLPKNRLKIQEWIFVSGGILTSGITNRSKEHVEEAHTVVRFSTAHSAKSLTETSIFMIVI